MWEQDLRVRVLALTQQAFYRLDLPAPSCPAPSLAEPLPTITLSTAREKLKMGLQHTSHNISGIARALPGDGMKMLQKQSKSQRKAPLHRPSC